MLFSLGQQECPPARGAPPPPPQEVEDYRLRLARRTLKLSVHGSVCVSQCGRMLELECAFVCVRIYVVILHKAATPQ
jgi:hypothetical protein